LEDLRLLMEVLVSLVNLRQLVMWCYAQGRWENTITMFHSTAANTILKMVITDEAELLKEHRSINMTVSSKELNNHHKQRCVEARMFDPLLLLIQRSYHHHAALALNLSLKLHVYLELRFINFS
jgi:hypothetical protein